MAALIQLQFLRCGFAFLAAADVFFFHIEWKCVGQHPLPHYADVWHAHARGTAVSPQGTPHPTVADQQPLPWGS